MRDSVCHLSHLTAVFCIKFHASSFTTISDHIAVVFSFKSQERVWCIWSVQTPGSTCTIKDRSLKTFLIIWHTRVSKRNGDLACIELVCLTRREICPLRDSLENNNNNLLISSAQVSTIRFSNARYKEQNNLGIIWVEGI